jgi:outer membrane protein assembly factor BamB
VFLISDQAELIRLDRETGEKIWGTDLPYFVRERLKRRKRIFAHYGPVLAGGRLLVGSNDDQIRSFDPATGEELGSVPLRGGAASNPVIVDRTLYIVTANGQLAAFR